jgi:SPP1 gp7 family putative phage head morphogenesis protein
VDQSFVDDISNHLFEAIQTAEALGRSLLVEKDRQASEKSSMAPARFNLGKPALTVYDFPWIVCDDKVVRIAFDLIPEDALAALRARALTIAGVEINQLLKLVQKALDEAIATGKSFDEFKAEVESLFDSFGVTKISNRHLETVFRTNLFSAYSKGQLAQAQLMADRFPVWRFSAIHDTRTRTGHRSLEGFYRLGDGPIPPVDYNCRCTAVYVHVSQSRNLQVKDSWDQSVVRFDNRPI